MSTSEEDESRSGKVTWWTPSLLRLRAAARSHKATPNPAMAVGPGWRVLAKSSAPQLSGALWPDSGCARQVVRGIAAERNEVRHLVWIDAVSLPDLFRPNARDFAAPRRIEDRCTRRGELKRIPIAARHQCGAACTLLSGNCGGEKVVRLVPRGFGVRKPKRGDKFGQDVQLLNQIIIELSPALISGKHFVAFRRRLQGVPSDNDRARLLIRVEPQQEIGEAEHSARRLAVAATNGFRQCVV
jgi:hypothetical protein